MGIVNRLARNIRAETEKSRAELLHQLKLPASPVEVSLPRRLGHRFEIPQGLQRDNFDAEVSRHAPRVARPAVEERQIVLEKLNCAKAGFGRGSQLDLK